MLKKLKAELDKQFSIYIRSKDADEFGITKCFTCGHYGHWRSLDCGHYVSRVKTAVRWEEKNCKPQCTQCNIKKNGNIAVFAQNLKRLYGDSVLDLLEAKMNNEMKLGRFEFTALINEYKELTKNIRK